MTCCATSLLRKPFLFRVLTNILFILQISFFYVLQFSDIADKIWSKGKHIILSRTIIPIPSLAPSCWASTSHPAPHFLQFFEQKVGQFCGRQSEGLTGAPSLPLAQKNTQSQRRTTPDAGCGGLSQWRNPPRLWLGVGISQTAHPSKSSADQACQRRCSVEFNIWKLYSL